MSSMRMISTEQWLLATKSTFTPYDPAHRRSPAMALSPMESLQLHRETLSDSLAMFPPLKNLAFCSWIIGQLLQADLKIFKIIECYLKISR